MSSILTPRAVSMPSRLTDLANTTGWRDLAILIARMTNATRGEAGSLTIRQATRELQAAQRVQDILNGNPHQ